MVLIKLLIWLDITQLITYNKFEVFATLTIDLAKPKPSWPSLDKTFNIHYKIVILKCFPHNLLGIFVIKSCVTNVWNEFSKLYL